LRRENKLVFVARQYGRPGIYDCRDKMDSQWGMLHQLRLALDKFKPAFPDTCASGLDRSFFRSRPRELAARKTRSRADRPQRSRMKPGVARSQFSNSPRLNGAEA
jgi:hypothetical protein